MLSLQFFIFYFLFFATKTKKAERHLLSLQFDFTESIKLMSPTHLTPKIPWDQKLVDCCLGSLCEEKLFFFNFFFWTSELHISQALYEHQARPIPTLYELVVKFC
jgi:hypothetical protein